MTTKIPKNYKRLSRNMQRIRKSKEITQEQLAEKVHVSTTWIGYLETGRKIPSIKMVHKIARALGIKVKDILPF